jgi:2-hydroxy-3-oxopropionate reductase
VVFIMVPDTPDVKSVAAKIEAVANGDRLIIDMSTIAPMAERAIAARMRAKGAEYLDAPVSGGETGAIEGILTIMVGGAVTAFDRARPLLEALGKRITYMGESGAGQVAKLANQIAVALPLEAAAEALLFARKGGLDPARVLDAIGAGAAAASWQLRNLGPKIIAHDYRPGFFVKLIRAAASVTSRKSLRRAKQWHRTSRSSFSDQAASKRSGP